MVEFCAGCKRDFTYSDVRRCIKYCDSCCKKYPDKQEKNDKIIMGIFYGEICPFCFKTLTKRYEGNVCKSSGCPLYFKLERGWVFVNPDSHWSINRQKINSFYDNTTRLRFNKEWAEKKLEILRRDDYTCRKCLKSQSGYDLKPTLNVHHIIPASQEMALFLDSDNLITLCENCHKEVHSEDKAKFGGAKWNK